MADTKEYNPFDHRPKSQKTTSTLATFMHLMKMSVGAGLLMLPYAFKQAGYITAIVSSFLMSAIMIHTAVTVIKCNHRLCKRAQVPSLTLSETTEAAFRFGPKALRGWSSWTGKFVNTFICLVQYQTMVVYAVYIAKLVKQIADSIAASDHDLRWYLMGLVPLFLFFTLVPSFRVLAIFSVLGFIFLSAAIVCSFYYFFKNPTAVSDLTNFTGLGNMPSYCAIFLFSLDNSSVIIPLENSMISPKKMPVVIAIAMSLSAIMYVIFGFLGYRKYSILACDTVIKNLPLDDLITIIVKILTAISVLFSYGLNYFILISVMWPGISNWLNSENTLYKKFFGIVGIALSTVQAVLIPSMIPVIGLVAAIIISTLMFLLPISIETLTIWNEPRQCKFVLKCVKNSAIFVIYVVILIVASYENVKEIVAQFSNQGEENCPAANSTMAIMGTTTLSTLRINS